MSAKILTRLITMLEERDCKFEAIESEANCDLWSIAYYPDGYAGDFQMITPKSLIGDQDWMNLSAVVDLYNVPSAIMPFRIWKEALDQLFQDDIGLSYNDVEDYDWKAEWEGENTPADSYSEWKLITGIS